MLFRVSLVWFLLNKPVSGKAIFDETIKGIRKGKHDSDLRLVPTGRKVRDFRSTTIHDGWTRIPWNLSSPFAFPSPCLSAEFSPTNPHCLFRKFFSVPFVAPCPLHIIPFVLSSATKQLVNWQANNIKACCRNWVKNECGKGGESGKPD